MQIIIAIALIALGAAICLTLKKRGGKTAETERLYKLLEQIENYGKDGNGR